MDTNEFLATLEDKFPSKKNIEDLLGGIKGIDEQLGKLADVKVTATVDGKQADAALVADSGHDDAHLEKSAKGMFDDIMSYEVWDIPVGGAVVGGFVAIVASELVDGFASKWKDWQRGLLKAGLAAASIKYGKRFFGTTGSRAVGLLLAFDAIRDLTPINSYADQVAEKISGTVTTAGLSGTGARGEKRVERSPQRQGSGDYYAAALGGGG